MLSGVGASRYTARLGLILHYWSKLCLSHEKFIYRFCKSAGLLTELLFWLAAISSVARVTVTIYRCWWRFFWAFHCEIIPKHSIWSCSWYSIKKSRIKVKSLSNWDQNGKPLSDYWSACAPQDLMLFIRIRTSPFNLLKRISEIQVIIKNWGIEYMSQLPWNSTSRNLLTGYMCVIHSVSVYLRILSHQLQKSFPFIDVIRK